MKVKEAINHLENYNPDEEICLIIWTGDDVKAIAKEKGMELTDKQITEAVSTLERRHDASIGISWDVIDVNLDWMNFDEEMP